jgi:hypothetical protein
LSPEPGIYSSCSAPASCWSSACGTVADGKTCTTYSSQWEYYNRCDRVSRTSTCHNGNWDLSPYSYSSCTDLWTPKQSCSAKWPCPATEHGWTCRAYSENVSSHCWPLEKWYTCDDGTWYMGNYTATPTWYSSCRQPYDCPAQNWCPSERWWNYDVPCVTYSESSAYYNRCDRVQITSYCYDWNWTPTPWSYTYCTNISWGPNTWGWGTTTGGSGGNTVVSYKWTYAGNSCSSSNAQTTSCTPWASCSDSGKTCCIPGSGGVSSGSKYYTCQ